MYKRKTDKKIWLSSPYMHGDELEYIREAYETNWVSTVGRNIDEVEKEISTKLGRENALALSSCTAAIHLAVKLSEISPGEKVFCQDMTFSATVNPVLYEGGTPVFIDTEHDTWNMDPQALEKAFQLYPEVKKVIITHLYGTPGKIDEIIEICEKHGAAVIEDAAESFGATYKGVQTGNFGRYSCISFNGNKIITGSAGGVLLTDEEESYAKAKKWATQSREKAPWYQHEDVGYNYRMSNIVAGVIRGQLPYLEEHIARKKAIRERYAEGLAGLPLQMNPYDGDCSSPNFWLSGLIIDEDAMCPQHRTETSVTYEPEQGRSCPHEILDALKEINAEGRPIWKPMHMQPIFAENNFVTRDGLQAAGEAGHDAGRDIFARGMCLPSDINMTEEDQMVIIEAIRGCFK